MQKLIYTLCTAAILALPACQADSGKQDTATASNTGRAAQLPADVLAVTKPLISGEMHSKPTFGSPTLIHFDTAQHIELLDTSGDLFVKARINRNAESYTGYISKAILPERP